MNWIESKVPQSKIYNKRELNLKHNETRIDVYDKLWRTNTKTLMDHLIEENGEQRKFGCLTEMCSKSPCQLGTLVSEFS